MWLNRKLHHASSHLHTRVPRMMRAPPNTFTADRSNKYSLFYVYVTRFEEMKESSSFHTVSGLECQTTSKTVPCPCLSGVDVKASEMWCRFKSGNPKLSTLHFLLVNTTIHATVWQIIRQHNIHIG